MNDAKYIGKERGLPGCTICSSRTLRKCLSATRWA